LVKKCAVLRGLWIEGSMGVAMGDEEVGGREKKLFGDVS
jgi:hypothetical protein